jgi:tRNA (Thr-GGU) A37 N-methylase
MLSRWMRKQGKKRKTVIPLNTQLSTFIETAKILLLSGAAMKVSATPVGIFLTPFKTPGQISPEAHKPGTEVVIDIFPQHKALLSDFKEYNYVTVMFPPQKNTEGAHIIASSDQTDNITIPSTEQAKRPALSIFRLKGILGSLVIVEGIDVLDRTPVLEINAYSAGFDIPDSNAIF